MVEPDPRQIIRHEARVARREIMFKRAMLALAFVGALVIGSLGLSSSAQAYHGHCGGGGGYYGGGYYPSYHTSYYGGYGPRYSAYAHRFGGHRHHRHHRHDHDVYYAPRSGVSFYFGF
jgi:hypothetical protein